MAQVNYKRKITHWGYGLQTENLQKHYYKVEKHIYNSKFFSVDNKIVESGGVYEYVDNNYIKKADASYITPLLYGGGVYLFFNVMFWFL